MADLQGKGGSSGDGGNRTREAFPPCVEPEPDPRAAYIAGLRELADFLQATPDATLPHSNLGRHFDDADEFDRAATTLQGNRGHSNDGEYEHCVRRFGSITFDLQTDGRAAQQIRQREQRLAEREAELAAREAVVFPQVDASGTLIREDPEHPIDWSAIDEPAL